ncbi:MAG: helix-turn-helix domain-containing protein [Clostridia bacterium]|nr:helix-turn-helix domain-containing protein [Clostridia bacterium]
MQEKFQRFDPRIHMLRRNFEIFHYREPLLDTGEVHHHDFYEIYFLLEGSVSYWVEGQNYHLKPGDIILINPMVLHRPVLERGGFVYERIVLWIEKPFLESLSQGGARLFDCFEGPLSVKTNILRLNPTQQKELLSALKLLVKESYSEDYGAEAFAIGILMQLMVSLNRISLNYGTKPDGDESASVVSEVMAYIREHYGEELSLESLAQRFFVSKYHLSHEFSRAVGTSIHRYITLRRILAAKQLLSEGISATEAAVRCGFKDYTGFYRAFKSECGISPRDFCLDRAEKKQTVVYHTN